jgi:predicted nucleotidyltransferase
MARPTASPLAPFFRSALQARILNTLFLHEDQWVPTTELISLGASHQAVRLELDRLLRAGVAERDTSARPHAYRIPSNSPLATPLRELLERTVGVEPLLRTALESVPGVAAAAIHGSWASQQATPQSDIDVIVLVEDEFDLDELREHERAIARTVGREIDSIVFPIQEARDRLRGGSGFLRAVLDRPLIPLVGDVRSALNDEGHDDG